MGEESKPVFSRVDRMDRSEETLSVQRVLKWLISLLLLLMIVGSGWWIWRAEQRGVFEILISGETKPEPDLARYEVLVDELKRWREQLTVQYRKARTDAERAAVEQDARVILELFMPEMMRCWLGTGYDFNGVAEKPGIGRVACGYYVSTVIRDSGFKVNRYKLAQQPSENILRTFVQSENCLLRVGYDYEKYVDWVEAKEPGIYLIGLDTHVGFIVNEGGKMKFMHSSGVRHAGVVEELRDDAVALRGSRWRMLGHFSGDPKVLRMWLSGEKVRVLE